MVNDHTILENQLKQWAKEQGFSLAQGMSPEASALKAQLTHLSGAQFDQRYIQDMMSDHQKDVTELQSFLNSAPSSPLKPVIEKTLPIVENHLRIAENVAGHLGLPPQVGLNHPIHPEKSKARV